MRFGLLGEVEAHSDGTPVDLGHARQRAVLAVLLVEANRPVPIDRLIDRVWADRPPHRARTTLYGYLHRLRRALAITQDAAITRDSGGYVLTVDPLAVDLHRFRHLTTQAPEVDDESRRLAMFEEALGLWRGPALTGLDTAWADTVRRELDRERFAAELDHTDLALRLGLHNRTLAPLSVRVSEHPLDERLAAQFMVALYRGGRPAEALQHYDLIRWRLAEELGTDPARPCNGYTSSCSTPTRHCSNRCPARCERCPTNSPAMCTASPAEPTNCPHWTRYSTRTRRPTNTRRPLGRPWC